MNFQRALCLFTHAMIAKLHKFLHFCYDSYLSTGSSNKGLAYPSLQTEDPLPAPTIITCGIFLLSL